MIQQSKFEEKSTEVDEESTVAKVLTKAIRYTEHTTSLFNKPVYAPPSPTRSLHQCQSTHNHFATSVFRLMISFIDTGVQEEACLAGWSFARLATPRLHALTPAGARRQKTVSVLLVMFAGV